MNRNLFLAILSMDSYNRGYGQGIVGLASPGPTNADNLTIKIGNATILRDANDQAGVAQAAGFYAIAYDMTGVAGFAAGERVISYRGTDKLASDAWWSYGIGAGDPSNLLGTSYGTVVGLTIDFYKAVLNGADPYTANVTLTGHSLGGGLAGYVAGLYGQDAVIFDNMTFNDAVTTTQYVSANPSLSALYADDLKQLVYGGGPVTPVDFSKISAFATTGELLSVLLPARSQQTPGVGYLDSSGGGPNPIRLHSMALLTLLKWNEAYGNNAWRPAGNELWNAYFSEDVAKTITATDTLDAKPGGKADPSAVLDSAIAYSAIDEGERPFGDTGIIAMFDDAGDLGRALNHGTATSQALKDSAGALAKALVEYAGKLALGDVEGGVGSGFASGILDLSSDGLTLAADFSADRWSHGAAHTSIIGRDELINTALATLDGDANDLATGMAWLYPTSGTSSISRVEFATTNTAVVRTLPGSGGFGTSASLFVGGDGRLASNDNPANERLAA
jgi:hypothetical protein